MLPYYLTENTDFSEVKTKRSITDMKKGPGDLEVALQRVILIIIIFRL